MGHRGRFELLNGEVLMMSPERAENVRTKTSTHMALATALARAGLSCEALGDGMTVRIDERTAYEPDAVVYCGPRLPSDAVEVPDPVIIVEVASPRTSLIDTGANFRSYFSVPSVRYSLIIDAEKRAGVHHARGDDGRIVSTSHTEGALVLDPSGIEVSVAEMLPTD